MEEPRIGVYVCWCGTNIAKMVDVEKVVSEIQKLPNVVLAKDYKYMCSDPGQELIIKDINEQKLDRIVVSACSPRIHELTFRKALQNAGLNPYLFEMANIREQVSWVHTDRELATQKAISLVTAAVRRVNFHEPLDNRTVEINPATLVIGGGVAGMAAALEIADAGNKVFLVERSEGLGGIAGQIDLSFPALYKVSETLDKKIKAIEEHPNIQVFLNTTIDELFGYIGNFETSIKSGGSNGTKLEFGNVIVATGLKPFNPSEIIEYGYGRLPNVVTSLEFEHMLKNGGIVMQDGSIPENIAIIHCVGSRSEKYHEYCSRTCCMTALKFSNQIRSILPAADVYEIYADMRAFGKGCEEFYTQSSRQDIMFLMYDQQNGLPEIKKAYKRDVCDMIIEFDEKLSGEMIEVPADLVVLMTAQEAHDDAKSVAHATGISMCGNAFFIEKHPKLDPVATTTDGVYIAGTCQGPKDIPESIAQGEAAAARVLATIAKKQVEVEVTTAVVNEDICCGCQTCIKVCPYTAIHFDPENNVSVVNEVLCKGCGTCGSTCPTGAIRSRHFTDQQILSQIEGLMSLSTIMEE